MKAAQSICKRELRAYFDSPVAYVVIGAFLLSSGFFFFSTFFIVGVASLRNFFSITPVLFVVCAPAITARFIAEERKTGTLELLFNFPIRSRDIVIGKFLAGMILVVSALLFTIPYVATVFLVSTSSVKFDFGPVIGGYVGLILMAASFLSLGMLASALTKNQVTSFIIGVSLCFFFYFIDRMAFMFPLSAAFVFRHLSIDYHFSNIARGVIDFRDVLFYVSLTSYSLILSTGILRSDRG